MLIINFMQSKQVEHPHKLMYANKLAFKYRIGEGSSWVHESSGAPCIIVC